MRDSVWQFLLLDNLLPCFVKTEIIECLAAWIYPKRNCKDVFLVFLVNVLTNPAAVFINFFVPFRITHPVLWVLFFEGLIWLVEALIFRRCLTQKRNPFLFSFVLNAASYGIGLFV